MGDGKAKRMRARRREREDEGKEKGEGWGKARWPHPSTVTSPSGKYSERKEKKKEELLRSSMVSDLETTLTQNWSTTLGWQPDPTSHPQPQPLRGLWVCTTWLSLPVLQKRQFRFKEVALPKITRKTSRRNPRWPSETSVLSTTARTSASTWLTGPLDFLIFFENK